MDCAAEDIHQAIVLISAIFTLHNFLIDEKDETEIEPAARDPREIIKNDDDQDAGQFNQAGAVATRDVLWRHICYLQNGESDSELEDDD